MLETTLALTFVVGLLYALRSVLRWRGIGGLAPHGGPRVVGGVALGPRARLCVVEAGRERLLLGVTDAHITLLTALAADAPAEPAAPASAAVAAPQRPAFLRELRALLLLAAVISLAPAPSFAEQARPAPAAEKGASAGTEEASDAPASAALHISLGAPGAPAQISSALELLALLTVVTLAPAILLMATCFTRIIVVLSLLRQAVGLQHMPPNQVLVGLALFLTVGVMAPVAEEIRVKAYQPYASAEIDAAEAGERALVPVRAFLAKSTREADLALFLELSKQPAPKSANDVPITALLPAYVISELRTAFEIGFMIFLPFLVVDLVVSSLLISMGMIVLPPVVVSLPFKLMLFVLADGWNLVLSSLVASVR
jgi:flagellar biosynthetic protein FliP